MISTKAWFSCLVMFAAVASDASAVTSPVAGRIVDVSSRKPVAYAAVTMVDSAGTVVGWFLATDQGEFYFERDLGQSVTLMASHIGYHLTRREVMAGDRDTSGITISMEPNLFVAAPIVVSASRRRETSFDAPASVTVIKGSEVGRQQSFTPLDPIKNTMGITFSRKGLLAATFNTRFRSGVMNGGTLVLQDHRYTRLPTLQLNIPYLLASNPADIDQIEIIRGPAASLYGPEGGLGVVHIKTKSPFDQQATSVSFAGGERSVFETWVSHSALLGENLGYRVSSKYFRGEDWLPRDPAIREQAHETLEQATSSAQVEWRPDAETRLIARGGTAYVFEILDQAPATYAQLNDFSFNYAQLEFHKRRFMTNLAYSGNDAGETFFVPSNVRFIDRSFLLAGQILNAQDVRIGKTLHQLSYGVDWRNSIIRSEGTLTGRFEDDDTVTEIGAYTQVTSVVSPKWDVVASVRADHHDRLANGTAFPFRLGVVFEPKRSRHALRLTFNRSDGAPSPSVLFEDFPIGGQTPFQLKVVGIPKGGWTFPRDANGGFLMRSAFVPGGLDDFGTADATRTWGALQAMIPQLASVPAPSSSEAQTDLRIFQVGSGFVPFNPGELQDVHQLERTVSEYVELGYKGLPMDNLEINIDGFVNRRTKGLTTELRAITPNVFYDVNTLETYLSGFMTPAEAAAVAQQVSSNPVGTVAPREAGSSSEILLAFAPLDGARTSWGIDINARVALVDQFSLAATYGYHRADARDEFTSVPQNRGAVRLEYQRPSDSFAAALQVRSQSPYTMDVAVWTGKVESFTVVDLDVAYRPDWLSRVQLFVNVSNLLDEEHVEIVGGKELGRLATARIQFDF
ncbi:MAG: TonB-dependent receptor [Candidatus Krumholzibacteria bacterium]